MGKLTVGAGAVVGEINLDPKTWQPALLIEEGAQVGVIRYNNREYTMEEWMASSYNK
jgi:hypothetical protein